jgi:hypothetical protein
MWFESSQGLLLVFVQTNYDLNNSSSLCFCVDPLLLEFKKPLEISSWHNHSQKDKKWVRYGWCLVVSLFSMEGTLYPNTLMLLPFWHKLNCFSFCQTFEKLFIIRAKILIKSKSLIVRFQPKFVTRYLPW